MDDRSVLESMGKVQNDLNMFFKTRDGEYEPAAS